LVSVNEQETHTGYIRGDAKAYFYTEEPTWIKKLEKCAKDFPQDVKITKKTNYGVEIEYPVEWFGFNSPKPERKKKYTKPKD
jgi:hypothetical protein